MQLPYSDNQPTQADFVYQSSGFQTSFDDNASRVIVKREIMVILPGQYKAKDKKKTMRSKEKVGAVCPEPSLKMVITPSEIRVSRLAGQPAKAQVDDLGNSCLQVAGFSGE